MKTDGRQRVSTGSPYEPVVGISRAIRAGPLIAVTGTAPLGPDGKTVGVGDPAAQARRCLEIARDALQELGAELRHVHRTRTLLTRIEDWNVVARVHGEFFRDIRPANTIMQVTRFIDPEWLVEFEVDAYVDDEEQP
ncbi:MAG: RidA family protein [Planctomycetota bacterium]|jgi:enamine deaminase RidA (YjgF/YER057c/UK114 family)